MGDQPSALTPAVFVLLLALHEGDNHGYALMAHAAELSGGMTTLGPGTVYRSLRQMRTAGLVVEVAPVPMSGVPADRRAARRRRYRITPAGRAAAVVEARRLARLVHAARRLGVLSGSV